MNCMLFNNVSLIQIINSTSERHKADRGRATEWARLDLDIRVQFFYGLWEVGFSGKPLNSSHENGIYICRTEKQGFGAVI